MVPTQEERLPIRVSVSVRGLSSSLPLPTTLPFSHSFLTHSHSHTVVTRCTA